MMRYDRLHSENRQTFIDAVKPKMQAAQKLPGCIFTDDPRDKASE